MSKKQQIEPFLAQQRRYSMILAWSMCTKYHKIPISVPYRPYQKHKGDIAKKNSEKPKKTFFEKTARNL